jgi:photosystem II stability/assembly factor-like uncharacterized protein
MKRRSILWLAAIAMAGALLIPGAARSTGVGNEAEEGSLVSFPRANLGYFVTARGVVRESRDAGGTWQAVGSVAPLVSMDFVSPSHGFGLSTRGALWATSDAGRTWRRGRRFAPAPGELGGPLPLMEVEFVDRRFGFVAAGPRRIFRTRDGGQTWKRLRFGCPRSEYLGGLAFANRRVGFAACGGQPATAMQWRSYAFTANGGTTWRRVREKISSGHVALAASPSPRVRYVYASRLGIFRLGGPVLLFTDDTDSVLAMSWPTPRVGYALLLHGGLRRTVDGGRHWRRP